MNEFLLRMKELWLLKIIAIGTIIAVIVIGKEGLVPKEKIIQRNLQLQQNEENIFGDIHPATDPAMEPIQLDQAPIPLVQDAREARKIAADAMWSDSQTVLYGDGTSKITDFSVARGSRLSTGLIDGSVDRVSGVVGGLQALKTVDQAKAGFKQDSPVALTDLLVDTSFGSGGWVALDLGGSDYAQSAAIQSDNKIVVMGGKGGVFSLARYTRDGSQDTGFGAGGKVTTDFGGFNHALSVAIQQDGKIVVVGENGGNFAVTRYTRDGSQDTGFGAGGKVTTDFGGFDQAHAVAVQADGKIVAVGGLADTTDNDFAVARYTRDGSLDTGFGEGGRVTTDSGGDEWASAVALQPNGMIVVAGQRNGDFIVVRYNRDGSLDAGFNGSGSIVTDLGGNERAPSVFLQPDGRIVVVGSSDTSFNLVRYNSDGSLDDGFGAGGKVSTNFGGWSWAASVAMASDGKIVVAGGNAGMSHRNFALARYNSNGSLDKTFGGLQFSNYVAIQADGKILVMGENNGVFGLARYASNQP